MKAQESHIFEDDEYEELDQDEQMDEMGAIHCTTIEETFFCSSDSSDPYVIDAIDASLVYGYIFQRLIDFFHIRQWLHLLLFRSGQTAPQL